MAMGTNMQPLASGTVQRKQKNGTRIAVPCPEVVIVYNQNMGAVDRGELQKKSRKYYKYIYLFLFEVGITSGYILYKSFHPSPKYKQFRLQLAQQLL